VVCQGVNAYDVYGLLGRQSFGVASMRVLSNVTTLSRLGMPVLQAKLQAAVDPTTVLREYKVPYCLSVGGCVRSPFCDNYAVTTQHPTCASCTALLTNKTITQHATMATRKLALIQDDAASKHGTPCMGVFNAIQNNVLPTIALAAKVRALSNNNAKLGDKLALARKSKERQELLNAQTKLELVSQFKRTQNTDDLYKFLDTLEHKALNMPTVAPEIVKCIVDSMVRGRRHRHVTEDMKLFFARILLHGGPHIHDLVGTAVLGPSLSTTRRRLAKFKKGKMYEWSPDRFEEVNLVLDGLGLTGAPCMLVEDGTALEKHFDVVRRADKVVFIGAASPSSFDFKSVADFQAFRAKAIHEPPMPATIFYLYLLVPLVVGAPAIPVVVQLMDGKADTYNATSVSRAWRYAWHHLLLKGINMVGHSGDGAAPFRSATLKHLLRAAATTPKDKCIRVPHFLVQLVLPNITFRNAVPRPLVIAPDFLHIMFRLRRQFLDPKRILVLFRLVCSPVKLITYENLKGELSSLGLRAGDMDFHDKQNFEGCLRLFDIGKKMEKGVQITFPVTTIRDVMKNTPEYFGLYMFLEFCHRFTCIFVLKDISIRDILINCAFCLTFVGYWDMSVHENPQCTRRCNFITKETKDDIIMLMNVVILSIKLYSIHFPNVRFVVNMMSSRFNEYAFQGLRLGAHSNNNRISALDGLNRIEIMQGMILAEHGKFHLQGLKSKRGMPKSTERIDKSWNRMPDGYYPTEPRLLSLLDEGVQQAMLLFTTKLTGPGTGGEVYAPWESITANRKREVAQSIHTSMAKSHLLNQKPQVNDDWDTFFDVSEPPVAPYDHIPTTCTQGVGGTTTNETAENDAASNDVADDYAHDDVDEHIMDACCDEAFLRMGRPPTMDESLDDRPVMDLDLTLDCDADVASAPSSKPTPGTSMGDVFRGCTTREAVRRFRAMSTSRSEKKSVLTKAKKTDVVASQIAKVLELCNDDATRLGKDASADDDPIKAELDNVEKMTRRLARELNSLHRRRLNLRTLDRFGQYALMDPTKFNKMLNDVGGFEDEDYIAVWYVQPGVCDASVHTHVRDRLSDFVAFAMIERCLSKDTAKGKLKDVTSLTTNDKEGELVVRWFENRVVRGEHTRSKQVRLGGLQYYLPLNTIWGYSQRVKCEAVLMRVHITLPDKVDKAGNVVKDRHGCTCKEDFYVLPREDEEAVVKEVLEQVSDGRIQLRDTLGKKASKRAKKRT
jgi:hypothetical protein